MNKQNRFLKIRLLSAFGVFSIVILAIILRTGYWQIVRGDSLRLEAFNQWVKDTEVDPRRGTIYDRNGKKLATTITKYTVSIKPSSISAEKQEHYSTFLAEQLSLDADKLLTRIEQGGNWTEIKRWIDKDIARAIEDQNLKGVSVYEDKKRFYPFGDFAAKVIGNTNRDNVGQYGIENTFNKYLTGMPGRKIQTVDGKKMDLPYDFGKVFEAEHGANVVLTIDEKIQYFAEKAAKEALLEHQAKNVSILVMEPSTGDILAMTSSPSYDPNNRTKLTYDPDEPWRTFTDEEIKAWDEKPWDEIKDDLYKSWSNFAINANYEPGSTFKILVAAAALEEGLIAPNETFQCDGYVTQVPGNIKCWSYRDPHGEQTFAEGVQNSCNEVFVEAGLRLGQEKMYRYAKAFGFGNRTGIDLPGEAYGYIRTPENMGIVNLATVSFGQGISVTPIQLLTAVSSIANDGKLMAPRIVKQLIDEKGETITAYKPKVIRQVVSQKTAHTTMEILESVVSEGTGKGAYVQGYRVGGKTGTAQKVVDGRYADGKYIASFMAVAPSNDPRLTVLVIIDEPRGKQYYGGQIAAPIAGDIIKSSLNYLKISPQSIEGEKIPSNDVEELTITP